MNICMVSQALPYLPSRGGFRLYGANLMRELSKRHRIDLISLLVDSDHEHLDWARQYCAQVETIEVKNPRLTMRAANFVAGYVSGIALHQRAELARLLSRGMETRKWDVIHFEGDYVASLAAVATPLALGSRSGIYPGKAGRSGKKRQKSGALDPEVRSSHVSQQFLTARALHIPTVLSLHDSWTLRCREMMACAPNWRDRLYYSALAAREPRFERQLYPKFDRCIVVAKPDLEELRRVVPCARPELIPYGTDTKYFYPVPVAKQPASLVFHGHLGYRPNVEAVTEFARVIFPLVRIEEPNATFHIVGADPAPEVRALAALPGVRLSENLPDIRPSVCASSIYVCAIRHGTGLKSKVLEAMAMQMPIVAYHPGSTVGIACKHAVHLMAAESPESFAQYVLLLLKEPQRAERLASAARDLVKDHYSWESRAAALEDLYGRLQAEYCQAA